MKPSRYNFYHSRNGSETLIWNSRTGALLCADDADAQILAGGGADDAALAALEDETKELFGREGLLVESTEDELADLEEEIRFRAEGADAGKGGFYRVLVTTGCNACCPYCYEEGCEVKTMDELTARQVAEFIIERQTDKPALIEWFGGEPLMNHRVISSICRKIKEAGCGYSSVITTNGSLWTADLIRTAREAWNLKKAQITLDGIGEEHEEIKGLPHDAFRDTIKAVYDLCESGAAVQLRVNHYKGEDHERLIRWIAAEFTGRQGVTAYVEPGYAAGDEYPAELMKEVLGLNMILREARLVHRPEVFLPQRRHIGCFACNPHNYTIAPDGKIYNCSHNMSEEQCIGNVISGVCEAEKRSFLRRQLSDKCRECGLLPVCMGGCRSGELKTAAMTQCPPFRNIIPDLMELQNIYNQQTER